MDFVHEKRSVIGESPYSLAGTRVEEAALLSPVCLLDIGRFVRTQTADNTTGPTIREYLCAVGAGLARVRIAGYLNYPMHLIVHPLDQSDQSAHASFQAQGEIREPSTDLVYASMIDASVGADSAKLILEHQGCARVVLRCGEPVDVDSHEDEAARLLASWSQAGWTKFDEDLVSLDEQMAEAGIEMMIRPSASGMLSDAICTMSWARRSGGLACSLLLDPVGWLTGSMLRDVDDHLRRFAELCDGCDKTGAVMLRSVKRDESGGLIECSLSEGELDPELVIRRLGGLAESGIPVVVLDSRDLAFLKPMGL